LRVFRASPVLAAGHARRVVPGLEVSLQVGRGRAKAAHQRVRQI